MSPDGFSLSASSMIALASETLSLNGYRVVRDMTDMKKLGDRALLAEDAYSVVSVVAFETWQQLEKDWVEAQADLVDLLGRRLSRSAPKAWDGYLVLLCAGEPPARVDAEVRILHPDDVADLLEATVTEGDVGSSDELVVGVAVEVAHQLTMLGGAEGADLQNVQPRSSVERQRGTRARAEQVEGELDFDFLAHSVAQQT